MKNIVVTILPAPTLKEHQGLHRSGFIATEIAKQIGIGQLTVYRSLQELAE